MDVVPVRKSGISCGAYSLNCCVYKNSVFLLAVLNGTSFKHVFDKHQNITF